MTSRTPITRASDARSARTSRAIFSKQRFVIILLLSLFGHLIFMGVVLFSGPLWPRSTLKASYNVSLMNIPMGLQAQLPPLGQPSKPAAQTSSPAPEKPKPEKPKPEKPKPEKPKPKPSPKPKASVPSPDPKKATKPQEKPKAAPPETNTVQQTDKNNKDTAEPEEVFTMGSSQDGTARSGSMMVEGGFFPYTYYLQIVRDKIARNWFPPFGVVTVGESLTVTIYFQIDVTGKILTSDIRESSGNSLLDQSSLRAVLVSSPFPPLPFGFTGNHLGIHFRFECYR